MPFLQQNGCVANGLHLLNIMRHEQHGHALVKHRLDLSQTLFAETGVAYGQHLIQNQNIRLHGRGNGKAQAGFHTGRIVFQRHVNKLAQLGECHNLVILALQILPVVAQNGTVQENIFLTGVVGVKAGAQLQQRRNHAFLFHSTFRRLVYAYNGLEQRGFTGTVQAQNAQMLAPAHLEVNVLQGIKLLEFQLTP